MSNDFGGIRLFFTAEQLLVFAFLKKLSLKRVHVRGFHLLFDLSSAISLNNEPHHLGVWTTKGDQSQS